MSECYCDYEMPTICDSKMVKAARKSHKCCECRREIKPGESYENTFGVWDGSASTYHTCSNCLALREFVKAHVPCFCWSYGNAREDALDAARNWEREAPGLLFGALRREVLIRRARSA